MSEMKDRIKRVINLWALNGSQWQDDLARNILIELREPTDAMTEAGWEHTGDPCWQENVADAWRAMIDVALADAPNH